MNAHELQRGARPPPMSGEGAASPGAGSAADAHAFDSVMSGFGPTAPVPSIASTPSMLSQMVRLPSRAYSAGMAEVQAPLPPGMTVLQSMEFYAHKQIRMNEMKILQNMSGVVVRMARKDIETVLNSK